MSIHPEAESSNYQSGYDRKGKKAITIEDKGVVEEGFNLIFVTIQNLIKRIRKVEAAVGVIELAELGDYIVIVTDDDFHPFEVMEVGSRRLTFVEGFDSVTDAVALKRKLIKTRSTNGNK